MKTSITYLFGCATLFAATQAPAQLFLDQMNNGAAWGKNSNAANDDLATFNYDYSANQIPEAPNSQGGDDTTRGLKLEANLTQGGSSFFTLYPIGQNFTGSHQLRFDSWMNYGTGGTTEFIGGGLGYNNVDFDLAGGVQAIATGDGGSSNDWRVFKDGPFFIPDADMTAGTHQGSDSYYADFLPSVNGSAAGSPGFQWVTWEFNVIGDDVSIFIEKPDASRLEIVSYDKTDTSDGSTGSTTDGNISLFYADFFSSLANPAAETFGLIDNVVVNRIPEPTAGVLALVGGLLLLGRRRK